jgi:hypothetical protein
LSPITVAGAAPDSHGLPCTFNLGKNKIMMTPKAAFVKWNMIEKERGQVFIFHITIFLIVNMEAMWNMKT